MTESCTPPTWRRSWQRMPPPPRPPRLGASLARPRGRQLGGQRPEGSVGPEGPEGQEGQEQRARAGAC